MSYTLIKEEHFSGKKASIYSLLDSETGKTLLEEFFEENEETYLKELQEIFVNLKSIGKVGARDNFFKLKEGSPGDGVVALYDDENRNLRLYCILCGKTIVIVGSGGPKPKEIRALQEDEKLTAENYFLREISKELTQRIIKREIRYINDYLDFEGDLTFEDGTF